MWISWTRAIFLLLFVILSSCAETDGKSSPPRDKLNILAIFAHLGKSHFDVFKPLLEELARRGHNVTVISHFPRTKEAIAAEALPSYRDVSLLDHEHGVFINVVDLKTIHDRYFRLGKEMFMLYYMSNLACAICLKHPAVKQLVESGEKFDLLFVESFNTNCFLALVDKFDAPFIQISTHQLMPWVIDEMGLSHEASYIPAMLTRLPRPMNFFERTMNALTASALAMVFHTVFDWRDRALAEETYGPGVQDLKSISNRASLMMVNTHYTLHGSIAFPANVIEVGGLHISPKVNPLPKNIAKFLDEADEGVLYFNLGSMVKAATMPEDKVNVLLKVFSSIPRKVIWKWEVDDMPNLPKNVLIQKWLPQNDILQHRNIKCYLGHGGLLGMTEGVQAGVPMILMPLFGDQYQNAIAAQARGVALVLSFSELSEETLRPALNEIFNNTRVACELRVLEFRPEEVEWGNEPRPPLVPAITLQVGKYQANAKQLAKAFRDRPATPMETAVWWTEYVGRGNGLPYLRSEAANMSWCQRNLVDVATFLVVVSLLILYSLYRVSKCLFFSSKKLEGKKRTTSKKRD